MALIVRTFIQGYSLSHPGHVVEELIDELEIINRGPDPSAHRGATDHCVYEVREVTDGTSGRAVRVGHARSYGSRRLTERALRALRPSPTTGHDRVDARTWAVESLSHWAREGADSAVLEHIVDTVLEAHLDGRLLRHP